VPPRQNGPMQGRKPTTDEIAERIELCRSMLLRRVPKSTIKRAFRQRFGADIDHGQLADSCHYLERDEPHGLPRASRRTRKQT
jgi:hypothetical protein